MFFNVGFHLQFVHQAVEAGGVESRLQAHCLGLDPKFPRTPRNGFGGQAGPHGIIERFLERLSGTVHRIAQHSLDILFEGNGGSHAGIMVLVDFAVKMYRPRKGVAVSGNNVVRVGNMLVSASRM